MSKIDLFSFEEIFCLKLSCRYLIWPWDINEILHYAIRSRSGLGIKLRVSMPKIQVPDPSDMNIF